MKKYMYKAILKLNSTSDDTYMTENAQCNAVSHFSLYCCLYDYLTQ